MYTKHAQLFLMTQEEVEDALQIVRLEYMAAAALLGPEGLYQLDTLSCMEEIATGELIRRLNLQGKLDRPIPKLP